MGKTVIEELIISLGLDAKALEDSKAIEAINTIRQSVTLLNGELKEAEKNFAAIGKVKMGSGAARASKTKKASDQDMVGMLGFPRPSAQAKKTDDKPIKVETVPSPKDKAEEKRKEKGPTSLKSMLTGMGGAVGTLAAGAYLFKSVAQGIGMIYNSMTQFLAVGQASKNVAEAIGLSAEQMSAFGSVATAMGKDSESVIADIDKLGKEYVSVIPGQFHQGLSALGVVPYDQQGNMRPYETILKEVFDKAQSLEGDKAYKKRILRETVGFSEGSAEVAMLGWDKFQKMHRGMVSSGLAPSEEMIQREANLKRSKDISGMKAGMIHRQVGLATSDLLVSALAGVMGTSGFAELMTKMQEMKPEELKKSIQGMGLPQDQMKELFKFMGMPDNPYQNVVRPGQMQDCRTGAITENMVINLSVLSDKAKADASINGKPMSNVRVNLSPNHTGQ